MPGTSITVDVDTAAVVAAVSALRAGLDDQDQAYQRAAAKGVQRTQAAAPKVSGALAGSVTATVTGEGFEITAGSGAVVYAGVQNYGWPARNIAAQGFFDPAQDAAGTDQVTELTAGIRSLIARVGLSG